MFDLVGKVVIITGGAKGIGAESVRSFLREGAKFIAFIDVDETSGISLEQELLKEYGRDAVKFFKCDVTKDEELFDVYNYTVKLHGCIDVVLNNAAIGNDSTHKREIEINFTALVTSTLKALELMRKDQGGIGGTIINVSSLGALVLSETPTVCVYCATKSAILLFSTDLGVETYYSHTGVRVITMCFGLTSTDIINNLRGIDDLTTTAVNNNLSCYKEQSPKAAAAGIVEAFKKGKTGSTWLVAVGEVTDISERVKMGYRIMSGAI